MMRRGFTVVELLITITIMGILLILAVVNLTSSQVNGRDSERKGDIEAISSNLESYYNEGSDLTSNIGRYPSTALPNGGATTAQQMLRNIDTKSLIAPGASDVASSFIAATNTTQTTAGVAPQPTTSQYVYQPLQADGSLCTDDAAQECRKFNLYYRLESDNTVYMVTSKNQ